MERGTRDLDLFGPPDQEKNYLDELNLRLAEVVEFNGQCGTGGGNGGGNDFTERFEIIIKKYREESERQSAQSANEIKELRRQLQEKNSRIEIITRERDDFRTRWERCTANSEALRQEIRTWQEKYEAEVAKNRTITKALEDEKYKNQRLQKRVDELTIQLETVLKEKRELESAWRIEKERYERTITELRAIIATHGNGSGKPCDPQVWERKLRKLLEQIRIDFEKKLEEYKKKYDEIKRQEVSSRIQELERELRRLRDELASAKGDVHRLRETIHKLEKEKMTLLRKIEELEANSGSPDKLQREIDELKEELRKAEKRHQHLIDTYGSKLDRRTHIQAGLKKYDNLVTVEEVRIAGIRTVGSTRPRPRATHRSGEMEILEDISTEDVTYRESASSGYAYEYRRETEE